MKKKSSFDKEHNEENIHESDTLKLTESISKIRESMVKKIDDLKQETALYKQQLALYKEKTKNFGYESLSALVTSNLWKGDTKTIVMAVVTSTYVDFAYNFLCALRALPFPPKIILFTTDYIGNQSFFFYYLNNVTHNHNLTTYI
jgi:hypothetical protein